MEIVSWNFLTLRRLWKLMSKRKKLIKLEISLRKPPACSNIRVMVIGLIREWLWYGSSVVHAVWQHSHGAQSETLWLEDSDFWPPLICYIYNGWEGLGCQGRALCAWWVIKGPEKCWSGSPLAPVTAAAHSPHPALPLPVDIGSSS